MFIDSACNLQRICKVLGSHLAIWTASRIIKVILTGLQCRVAHRTRPLGFWHPLAFSPIQSQLLPDVVAVWFYINASPIRFCATSIQRNDTKRYETAQFLFCHVWWRWGPPGSVDLWALGSLLLALFAPQIKARKSRQRRQRNNTLYTVCFDWSPARWIQKPQPIIKPNWMCPSSFSKAARFASRKTPWHVGRCVTEMARLYESTEYSQLRPCPRQQESCWSSFVCQFATTQVPYEYVFQKTMSLFSFGVFQKGDVQLGHTGPFHTMASQKCEAPNSNIVWYSPPSSSLPDFPCSRRLCMRQYLDDHKAFLSFFGHSKKLAREYHSALWLTPFYKAMRPRGQAASLAKRSGLQVLWHQTSELLQAHLSCIALGHDAELRHVAFRQGQQLGVAAAVQGSGLTKHAASKGLYACDSLECSKWVRYDGLIWGDLRKTCWSISVLHCSRSSST